MECAELKPRTRELIWIAGHRCGERASKRAFGASAIPHPCADFRLYLKGARRRFVEVARYASASLALGSVGTIAARSGARASVLAV